MTKKYFLIEITEETKHPICLQDIMYALEGAYFCPHEPWNDKVHELTECEVKKIFENREGAEK